MNNKTKKPYDFLECLLNDIEENLRDETDINTLADRHSLSSTHIRRIFQFAFKQTLGTYIRSRKLSSSINDLLNTNLNILDIALTYGFEYEQTYIRSFKREFGITPGDLRKTGRILKINPPLNLFDSKRFDIDGTDGGVFFGPDIVMVPQFYIIGRKHKLPINCELTKLTTEPFYNFIKNEKQKILNTVNSDRLINLSIRLENDDEGYFTYMPSLQVKSLKNIPEGFDSFTFPPTLCAKFCIIIPDVNELNISIAEILFNNIDNFIKNNDQKYVLDRDMTTIDIFEPNSYGGEYKLWEWFTPVKEKK